MTVSAGQTPRLFFGIPVAADTLPALRTDRSGWRWTDPANYHVTVAFLGSVSGALIPALSALGQRVAAGAARGALALSALEWWPDGRRPRLLVATAEAGPLLALQAALLEGLRALAVTVDERPLRPHVTLARLRARAEPTTFALPALAVSLPVAELALYESRRDHRGSSYVPLWRQALAG